MRKAMRRNQRDLKSFMIENARGLQDDEDNIKGFHDKINEKISDLQSKIDNLGKSSGETVDYYTHPNHRPPNSPHGNIVNHYNPSGRTILIPFLSSRMNTDSIFYDVTLGFIFAAIFTFTVALLSIFFNWCCVCVFCPKLHRKRMRKRRIRERRKWIVREQLFGNGSFQMTPLTKEYNAVPDEDDESRDQSTRMEYGQVDTEAYDDEDDYVISTGGNDSKQKGRYEEKDIEASANKYFGEDKDEKDSKGNSHNRSKGDDESVGSDSSNEACEPLLDLAAMELDLAMMEKKISDSMEKNVFI